MSYRKILTHAACWAILITYEVTVALLLGSKASFWQFATFYIPNIVLFYFNAHIVFGRPARLRNPWILSILIVGELAAYVAITLCLEILLDNLNLKTASSPEVRTDVIRAIWRGIYFIGLSSAYWFALRTVRAAKEAHRTKIQQLESEQTKLALETQNAQLQNAYLQAQANPHMLLNTLNFVYNAVEPYSDKAAKSILLLADLMRYALSEAQADGKVNLEDELDHIKRYIKLHQLKSDDQLHIISRFDFDKTVSTRRIPPLLLFTFVENVFKHGNLTKISQPGIIRIEFRNDHLHFYSENLKRRTKVDDSYHIGINNAVMRLRTYYGNEFDLAFPKIDGKFIVDLRLRL